MGPIALLAFLSGRIDHIREHILQEAMGTACDSSYTSKHTERTENKRRSFSCLARDLHVTRLFVFFSRWAPNKCILCGSPSLSFSMGVLETLSFSCCTSGVAKSTDNFRK